MPAASQIPKAATKARIRRPTGLTVLEAHARLDIHEEQIEALTQATHQAVAGTNELTKLVGELTVAVGELKSCLKSVVSDTEDGRKLLSSMLEKVIEAKTGSWVKWAIGAAALSARDWVPYVWKLLHG